MYHPAPTFATPDHATYAYASPDPATYAYNYAVNDDYYGTRQVVLNTVGGIKRFFFFIQIKCPEKLCIILIFMNIMYVYHK